MNFGIVRTAAISPKIKVGSPRYNAKQILKTAEEAFANGASILVYPELSITGYSCGDLFRQRKLLDAAREELIELAKDLGRIGNNQIVIVGLPLPVDGSLFNVAAILSGGKILGLIPKSYIVNNSEFYEARWFDSGFELKRKEVYIGSKLVPIGTDLLFEDPERPGLVLGAEICEDLWVTIPPSCFAILAGATIIANLSASNELVGKAEYRRNLVTMQSGKYCGYIYSSAGPSESSTEIVYGGHCMIAENGNMVSESERLDRDGTITYGDLDLEQIDHDRLRSRSFNRNKRMLGNAYRIIPTSVGRVHLVEQINAKTTTLFRHLASRPFVPSDPKRRATVCQEIFRIQANGLAQKVGQAGLEHVVIGLSGGLDSTMALLVIIAAFKILGLPLKNIHGKSLPCFATSGRTRDNARILAEAVGISFEEIDIREGVVQKLKDIGHPGRQQQDTTFENVQARYREDTLFNIANMYNAIVVGTGDLSEIAQGWCTFNADHMSHYHVNCSLPKTLIQFVIDWVMEQEGYKHLAEVLADIRNTPISPELVCDTPGVISQSTEDKIGPYVLHDFFLYHFCRWGSSPSKIFFLAVWAFDGEFDRETILRWLESFIKRFFNSQWKRTACPEGPKVGSVALSPRGDWRVPSDVEKELWLEDFEELRMAA